MGQELRRVGIVPACHVHQLAHPWLFLHGFNDVQPASIEEKGVIAKQIFECRNYRMILGIASASIWSSVRSISSEFSFIECSNFPHFAIQ